MKFFSEVVGTSIIIFFKFVFCGVSSSIFSVAESQTSPELLNGIEFLPREHESWESMRENKVIYVDKTMFLHKLLDKRRTLSFLPRPRRFGKSMFAQMMHSFFRGQKSYFIDTAIFNRGNWISHPILKNGNNSANYKKGDWIIYPVLYFDFSEIELLTTGTSDKIVDDLRKQLDDLLKCRAKEYGVDGEMTTINLALLIEHIKLKFNLPVIIIVDEFDNKINQLHEDSPKELVHAVRNIFSSFFSQIKDREPDIGIAWVTGVNKMAIPSLFSGPNNFEDLQFDDDFATSVGFTQVEIDTYFDSYLKHFSVVTDQTVDQIKEKLIEWYDGYHFSLNDRTSVFNPISVLKCLSEKKFFNWWTATSSIKILMKEWYRRDSSMKNFENVQVNTKDLLMRHEEYGSSIPLEMFMVMSGYLTITSYDLKTEKITLHYPNLEIKEVIVDSLRAYVPSQQMFIWELTKWTSQLKNAMVDGNASLAIEVLQRFGFPFYSHRLNNRLPAEQAEFEHTNRLNLIFEAAYIKYKNTTDIIDGEIVCGDIDVQTKDLPIDYIIEVKSVTQSREELKSYKKALKQVIDYQWKHEVPFKEVIGFKENFYLFVLIFANRDGGQLVQWVCLPYEHNRFNVDKATASKDIENEFREQIQEIISQAKLDQQKALSSTSTSAQPHSTNSLKTTKRYQQKKKKCLNKRRKHPKRRSRRVWRLRWRRRDKGY